MYLSRNRSDSLEKRKREVEKNKDIEEAFKKSKITQRSPVKNKSSGTPEMDEIRDWMTGIAQALQEVKEQMNINHADLKSEISKNTTSIEELKKEYEEKERIWQEEKKMMKDEIQVLRKRIEEQDKRNRRNNIVVKGLAAGEMKPKEAVRELLEKRLNISCAIKSATIIRNDEQALIILAELEDYEDKTKIMSNKNKLKGQEIYIDNDWTKEERHKQAIIRKKAKEEKEKGKHVKIFYNRLLVGDKNLIWNDEKGTVLEAQDTTEESELIDSKK